MIYLAYFAVIVLGLLAIWFVGFFVCMLYVLFRCKGLDSGEFGWGIIWALFWPYILVCTLFGIE